MQIQARVFVTLKPGVLDPQGKAVQGALESLHYAGIGSVRQGKLFELSLEAASEAEAQVLLSRMCEQVLTNPVIEDFEIELGGGARP